MRKLMLALAICAMVPFGTQKAEANSLPGFTTVRDIVYAQPDGRELLATLYMPDTPGEEALRPGMVLIHGGGWMFGTRYQQAYYCRNFARQGYVVMTIQYRMMPKHPFPDCVHDAKAAVRWLRANAHAYRVDPDRIVAFGASAGGHIAAFLGVTNHTNGFEGTENLGPSSHVNAVISLYGAVDLTQYEDDSGGIATRISKAYIRDFAMRKAESLDGHHPLAHASPITYADEKSPPMVFVHGTKDRLVHFDQSRHFYAKLVSFGVPTDLITVRGKDHGFDYLFWKKRDDIFDKMLTFLEKHNQPALELLEDKRREKTKAKSAHTAKASGY